MRLAGEVIGLDPGDNQRGALTLDREKTLQTAQAFVDRKRYDRALSEYNKIILENPSDTRTLLKIGDIQARSEDYPAAIKTYDEVASYYSDQGFALKAVAVYKQIRELIAQHVPVLADDYAHVIERLVANYGELGLVNDALGALDEEANRHRHLQREHEALKLYRRMTEVGSGAPIAHLRLAEGLCRADQIEEAMQSFWTAAQLLIQAGRKDDALRVIERMLHFQQDPTYAKLAARLYLQRGTEEQSMVALSRLQICFQADPKDLETLALLATAFQQIGQEPKSIEVKKEIARQAYDQARAELFDRTVEELQAAVPDDDQVKALAQLEVPQSKKPLARSKPPTVKPPPLPTMTSRPAAAPKKPPPPLRADGPTPAPPKPSGSPAVELDVAAELEALEESGVKSQAVVEAMSEAMTAGETSGDGMADQLLSEPAPDPDPVPSRAPMDSADLAAVHAHTRKALNDAQTFHDLNLFDKAIETIQRALEFDPRSIELREALRDLYAETDDREAAIEEMLTMAAIYVEYDRPDHAETVLDNILEAEPGHPTATNMKRRLLDGESFPVPPSSAPSPPPPSEPSERSNAVAPPPLPGARAESTRPPPPPASSRARISQPPSAPVSSRPKVGTRPPPVPPPPASRASSSPPRKKPPPPPPPKSATARPLPSRPTQPPPSSRNSEEFGRMSLDEIRDSLPPPPAASTGNASAKKSSGTQPLEEALEEAEFFIQRGLYDDARLVLEDQHQRLPNHPLVLEALEELEAAERHAEVAAAPERQLASATDVARPPMESEFDLEERLGELQRVVRESQNPPAGEAIDVEHVFEKFKAGVRRRVADNDSATHYNLGVAYKQMNLLDDAILEFELSAKDPNSEAACYAMIGSIYTDNELWTQATKALNQALGATNKTLEQEIDIYFRLGHVAEKVGDRDKAAYYFQQVLTLDGSHESANERLERVRSKGGSSVPAKSGPDDELDRAFDELLGGD